MHLDKREIKSLFHSQDPLGEEDPWVLAHMRYIRKAALH